MPQTNVPQPTFEDLKLLTEVSQLLTLLDLDTVMQQVISLMSSAVGAARASLFLHHNHDVDWDHIFLSRRLDPDQSVQVVRTVLEEGLAGWVMRSQEGTIVYDTQVDKRWHTFPDDPLLVRSALCVPFLQEGKLLAVLTLVHPSPNHFDEHHLHLLTIVANQAAVAIRNAQLYNQIHDQQRQLAAILQAIPDILLVVDESGRIVLINEPAQRLLAGDGHRQGGLVGERLVDYSTKDSAIATVQRIISTVAPERPQPFETRSDQLGKDFRVTISRWETDTRPRTGYVVVMHDVTQLSDLNRFKDEMIKVVTHDLRNPVALMVSAYDMLEHDLPPQPEDSNIPQYLNLMHQATDRMQELLNNLVEAEISNYRPVEPEELLKHALDALRPLAEQKQQSLSVTVEVPAALRIMVDPLLIREAIENYLSNAIKYTPRGGRISVRLFVRDERLHYEVEDTGIGVSTDDLPHLFEPYYRVERPETEDIDGHGIGLNLVRMIVQRHRGQVWVESTLGEGSRFGFSLPL